MGYWNGWSNFKEWVENNEYIKKCKHCDNDFMPNSPNQKYCNNPECRDDRHFSELWKKGKHPLQINL